MGRTKLKENKISSTVQRVKLFESTNEFVINKAASRKVSQAVIIREMCESARQEELTKGQFRNGTTNVFQSVQGKLIKKNVNQPIEKLTEEIEKLQRFIQDININTRFASLEVFKVLGAFFVENQLLVKILHRIEKDKLDVIDLEMERKITKAKYKTAFETRQDEFFTKYQRLTEELTALSESVSNDSNDSNVSEG